MVFSENNQVGSVSFEMWNMTSLEGSATLNSVTLQANYDLERDLVVWKTWHLFT